MTEPTETERAVLHGFIQGIVKLTNIAGMHVRMEELADALISGGVEMLRKIHGTPIAAERLRQVAAVIEAEHPVERH